MQQLSQRFAPHQPPLPRLSSRCNIALLCCGAFVAHRRGSIADTLVIPSREVELKLELDPADVERFRALPLLAAAAGRSLQQVSTYYDTPEGHLRKAGYSLRLRRKGRRCIQTVKQKGPDSGGFSARDEWEQRIAGPKLDFAALEGTPVGKLLSKRKLRERLEIISETRVKRTTWLVRRPRSTIEMILDEGEVAGGGEREAICEIELELKSGERRRLFDLAKEIGRTTPVRMGAMSKSERGFVLADGGGRRVRKAEPVVLAAEMDVADAFAAIVQSCLRHFRLNEALVVHGRKAAALHQLRVAMRRLRSAFSLFKPALAQRRFRAAAEAGDARAQIPEVLGERLDRVRADARHPSVFHDRDVKQGGRRIPYFSGQNRQAPPHPDRPAAEICRSCPWRRVRIRGRSAPSDEGAGDERGRAVMAQLAAGTHFFLTA